MADGYRVAVLDRNGEGAAAAAAEIHTGSGPVLAVEVDVADRSSVHIAPRRGSVVRRDRQSPRDTPTPSGTAARPHAGWAQPPRRLAPRTQAIRPRAKHRDKRLGDLRPRSPIPMLRVTPQRDTHDLPQPPWAVRIERDPHALTVRYGRRPRAASWTLYVSGQASCTETATTAPMRECAVCAARDRTPDGAELDCSIGALRHSFRDATFNPSFRWGGHRRGPQHRACSRPAGPRLHLHRPHRGAGSAGRRRHLPA